MAALSSKSPRSVAGAVTVVLVAISFLTLAGPFLVARIPPVTDYPNHLARYWLIAGGASAILVETCQDPLQIKAAINAAKIARAEAGSDIPLFVQITVETTGSMLVGTDLPAAAAIIDALDVPLMGLNCATGPRAWIAARCALRPFN